MTPHSDPSAFDPDGYLDVLSAEGTLVVATAGTHGLTGEIPNCPGWTMRELVAHLGWVYRWVTTVVGEVRTDPPGRPERVALADPDPGDDDGVIERLRLAHATVVRTLAGAPTDLACWTPWPAASGRDFWIRRQVHESVVHRVDAGNGATGRVAGGADLPVAVAADGVDELVCGFAARYTATLRAPDPVTLALHATDSGHRWWARIGPDAPAFGRGRAPRAPDAEVSARAGELFLLLWNRRAADGLDIRGDAGVLATWRAGAHQ